MEEENLGHSRLFVFLAVALIGLLVLGLLGIGGVIVIRKDVEQQSMASRPTPTALIRLPTPKSTSTPTIVPTKTPLSTPTSTAVMQAHAQGEVAAANRGGSSPGGEATSSAQNSSPTPKVVLPTVIGGGSAGKATVPQTGVDGFETMLIVASLVAVLAVARRLRR